MLPVGTPMGDLHMVEVYDVHDGPRLFACANRVGQHYLAYWYDSFESSDEWLYVPVSLKRLADIRRGAIPLRSAIVESEDRLVFRVVTGAGKTDWQTESSANIDPDTLPEPDDRLVVAAEPVVIVSGAPSEQSTPRTRRLAFDLRLNPHSYHLHEVDTRDGAHVLLQTQELIHAIAQHRLDPTHASPRGRIKPKIVERSQVSLVGTAPGSFVFHLAANEVDLFGESVVEDCLVELGALLQLGPNTALLAKHMQQLGLRVASKYKNFLRWAAKAHGDLTIRWQSGRGPDYDRTIHVPFATLLAIEAAMVVVEQSIAPMETHIGQMTMFDSTKLKFRMLVKNADNVSAPLSGEVLVSALEQTRKVTIGQRYKAELRVIYEVESVSGRTRRLYYLVGLTPA